jgi:hypothetical protein
MLEGLDDDDGEGVDDMLSPSQCESLRQESSSSLDSTVEGGSRLQKNKSEKAMLRAASRREKKVEKVERKFEKTKRHERMRVAEFGVISRKECEAWVMAVKSAISAMHVDPNVSIAASTDGLLDPPMRKSSVVIKSPSHGVVPGEFRKKTDALDLRAVKKIKSGEPRSALSSLVETAEFRTPSASSRASSKRSFASAAFVPTAEPTVSPTSPGLLQLPPLGECMPSRIIRVVVNPKRTRPCARHQRVCYSARCLFSGTSLYSSRLVVRWGWQVQSTVCTSSKEAWLSTEK